MDSNLKTKTNFRLFVVQWEFFLNYGSILWICLCTFLLPGCFRCREWLLAGTDRAGTRKFWPVRGLLASGVRSPEIESNDKEEKDQNVRNLGRAAIHCNPVLRVTLAASIFLKWEETLVEGGIKRGNLLDNRHKVTEHGQIFSFKIFLWNTA